MLRSPSGFKNKLLCWLTLLLCSLVLVSGAGAAEIDEQLNLLSRNAAAIESLYSPFVQLKHLQMFDEQLDSDGIFAYRSPDFLRWELKTPVGSGFVMRGDQGERWNSLSGETEHFRISDDPMMGLVSRQLLAWARFDLDWLKERYRIELFSEQPLTLRLVPLDQGEAGFITDIEIVFDDQRSHVQSLQLNEQEGDWTRLEFTALEVNSVLGDELFEVPKF